MIKRLIPLTLALFATLSVFAQVPKAVSTNGEPGTSTTSFVACPPGVTAFAGTSSQMLAATAQSNDVEFLCENDALEITHLGGQTFGDPEPSTDPGISYAFYTCAPTVSGVDLNSVELDPCHLNPNFPDISVTVDQSADILGNSTFTNLGLLQDLYSGGGPLELFFAPITVDDFSILNFEGNLNDEGPCIHVNTNDEFRVVYLNLIEGLNLNTAASGPCVGSFELAGGLPEFDNSTYTNISVSLTTDPTVTATLNAATYTHGDLVQFTVPQAGTYNVVIEDDKSCAANFTVDMSACTAFQTIADDVVTLPGQAVCVEVSANGFTEIGSFQYSINFDPTILTFTTINAVGIPDDLLIFGSPSAGVITLSWTDATFSGLTVADGTIIYEICFNAIGAVGQTSPITFSGSPTPTEVTTTDGINNFFIESEFTNGSVTISSNSITLDVTSCSTTTDEGTIGVTPSGGTAAYNITYVDVADATNTGTTTVIANGLTTMFTNLIPGTYEITAIDANGDTQTATITVANSDEFLAAPSNIVPPECSGGTNGSISVITNGGVSPVTYLWSTGATTQSISMLPTGSYSVTATDANGCEADASTGLLVDAIILETTMLTHISCVNGNSSGAITVNATGGAGGFDYEWATGQTIPNITNLTAGSYTVSATDANLCVAVLTVTVDPPLLPIIEGFDSIPVACAADMTGELTPDVTLGNSPIIGYQWGINANNQTTETAVGLSANTLYSVTITDATGCTDEDAYTLFAPPPLVITPTVTPPTCADGSNDGQINLTITGGDGNHQIMWDNGTSGTVLPALACGTSFSVAITSPSGCGDTVLVIPVPCPPAISIAFAGLVAVDCDGEFPCDGGATATASGGTPDPGSLYDYEWSSGESNSLVVSSTAAALCQGLQMVTVTDALGCMAVGETTIDAPAPLLFDLVQSTGTQTSCFGDSDGSITVVATGGTPDYDYNWTNPVATGPTVSGLPAGNNYFVVVTDDNGCTIGSTFQVTEPDVLVAEIDEDNSFDANCFGSEDGQISATSMGGTTGDFTYEWSPNVSTESTAINVGVGTYTVTVTDINGCSDVTSHNVSQPDPIFVIVAEPEEPRCNGLQTVVTLDSVSGGVGPSYTFSVDFGPPQFENAAIPILAGTHTITVFDSICSTELEITVSEPLPVLVDLGPDTTIQLGDSLQLDPAIGSILPIDTLFWNPLTFLSCWGVPDSVLCDEPWVAPLQTQMYELTVIDTNGCSGSDQIIVDIDKNRNVFIPNAFSPNGDGVNDFFKIYTGVGVERVNYFRIYDRWGEQLFQDDSFLPGDFYIGGWDGRFKGKLMDNGVFIYIAEVQFVDGVVLLYRGDVTLVR